MSRRVRVLQIVLDLEAGGLERMVADLMNGLDPARFESHILPLHFLGRHGADLEAHAAVHEAPPSSRWSLLRPLALTRAIAAIAPDVVHTHSGTWYKGARAARAAGVRLLVHTDHGRRSPDPWIGRVSDRLGSRYSDAVIAVSDALAEVLVTRIGVERRKVRTILNGVDTARFAPAPDSGALRARLGIPREAPLIGSLGRFDAVKRYDLMIDAFDRLRADWPAGRPAPHLVIAGEGPDRPALERALSRTPYRGDVHLPGWVSDVHELHEALQIFSLSSRSEGTSMSLLEAMSAGICPVVTDVGGNRAVLGPTLAPRLVPAESAAALADGWRSALGDEGRRTADARAARRRVEEAFSLRAMVQAYQAVYLEGASDPSSPVTGASV